MEKEKNFVDAMEAWLAHAKLTGELTRKRGEYETALRARGFSQDEAIAEIVRAIPIAAGPSLADVENSYSAIRPAV